MAHPERLVVGHPFNPVYLLPLVEVCGGDADRAGRDRARGGGLRSVGMRRCRAHRDRRLHRRPADGGAVAGGAVAGRTTTSRPSEEIDDAIRFGAGLRWASWGTFLTYRHRRRRGRHAPLHGPVRAGAEVAVDEADGRPRADRRAARQDRRAVRRPGRRTHRCGSSSGMRDDCLVAVLQALRTRRRRRRGGASRLGAAAARACGPGRRRRPIAGPARCTARGAPGVGGLQRPRAREPLPPGVRRRHGRAAARLGIDEEYLAAGGSYYTVETHCHSSGGAGRRPAAGDDAVAGVRRQAPARVPLAPPRRRRRAAGDGGADAAARRCTGRPGRSGAGRAARSGRATSPPCTLRSVSRRGGQADCDVP